MSMHRKILDKELKNLTENFLNSAPSAVLTEQPISSDLNNYIDHTLLKPDATIEQLETLCSEAKKYNFKTVCVPPHFLNKASALLEGTSVKPITVIGFPLGYQTTATKVFETQNAITLGAKEIDMVINISALKSGEFDLAFNDIKQVIQAAKGVPVKVIIETAYLTLEEKIFSCACIQLAGAEYIKTSTGFAPANANIEDIILFKHLLGDNVKIKASGGIKSREQALSFIKAGANRIGTSSGVAIATGAISDKAY